MIEVKIPKEVRQHKETICLGLSLRQFICALIAVIAAAWLYLGLGDVLGKETASWLCILAALPLALAGFFNYNGMTGEQFVWAVIKSEILCGKQRKFVSDNFHYNALCRKESSDFD